MKLGADDDESNFGHRRGKLYDGQRGLFPLSSQILACLRRVKCDGRSDCRADVGEAVCPLSGGFVTLLHIFRGYLSHSKICPKLRPSARREAFLAWRESLRVPPSKCGPIFCGQFTGSPPDSLGSEDSL